MKNLLASAETLMKTRIVPRMRRQTFIPVLTVTDPLQLRPQQYQVTATLDSPAVCHFISCGKNISYRKCQKSLLFKKGFFMVYFNKFQLQAKRVSNFNNLLVNLNNYLA